MNTTSPADNPHAAKEQHGMRHRSYRGKVLYLSDGIGEMGREYFSVTVQPDGERTLRAQCEMDNDRLLRDVLITVGGDWRPRDAFLRLTIEERLVGSSWFHFTDTLAECEGFTARDGRFSQRFERTGGTECFGTHALCGDAWLVARIRNYQGDLKNFALWTFASSILANGGSGPELIPLDAGYLNIYDLGPEQVSVPAGTFETHHVRLDVPGVDDFEIWAHGEDSIPVQVRSHVLKQSFELVELEGDVR